MKLMNDSPYGLTASIWTNAQNNPKSHEAFLKIVDQLETGTVFLNRLLVSPLWFEVFPYKIFAVAIAWTRRLLGLA